MKNVKCVICGGRTYNRRKTCSDECFALRQKELTNRTCYGMELDPKYVDVIRKRYAKFISPDTWEQNWQDMTPVTEK